MSVLALPRPRLSARRLLVRAADSAAALWIGATIALLTALAGHLAFVGGDARWAAALGRAVVQHGVPRGIPFASAPTSQWANTLVLAEVCFYWLERGLGDTGLVIAQTVAVAIALSVLARDARSRGASRGGVCAGLVLVAIGAATSLVIVRVQLFSLALFPILLTLVRADARARSARIWLVLPLLALWSNLHGAAISGLLVLYPYLLISRLPESHRRERLRTIAVALLSPLALCLTPAGLRSFAYYHGLLTNLAASRGVGMWAALGTGPFDLLLIAVGLLMVALCLRARTRPALWELVVAGIFAVATVKASRDGVWLLFVLLGPAALGLAGLGTRRRPAFCAGRRAGASKRPRDWIGLLPIALAAAVALAVADIADWTRTAGTPQPAIVGQAVTLAHGSPILADTVPGEQVALVGGRIWAGNPIDAFSHEVQATYLDFTQGEPGGAAALALPQVHVALVTAGSGDARLLAADQAYRLRSRASGLALYVRWAAPNRRPGRQGGK